VEAGMNADADWWRTFFDGLFVEGWLQATPEEQTRIESAFIEKTLRLPPHSRVLDAPCGGGRHCLALAARGYRMTGIDISPQFLQAARASANEKQLDIDWRQGDMSELPWKQEFDGAFCFGNSFGYFDDEGNAAFLRAVAASLKDGGRFLLDYPAMAETLVFTFQERSWHELGNLLGLRAGRYDPVSGRIYVDYTFLQGSRIEKKQATQRVYTYREVCRLLEQAGFGELEAYASPAGEPYQFGAKLVFLAATKRGAQR
jgi:SAM-dependent methyltransferase